MQYVIQRYPDMSRMSGMGILAQEITITALEEYAREMERQGNIPRANKTREVIDELTL